MAAPYTAAMQPPSAPLVDPATGVPTAPWWHWFLALYTRTGSAPGISTGAVQTQAVDAQTSATTAQAAAGTAQTAANTAQTTANAASVAATSASSAVATETAARIAAVATEQAARIAADALLAPIASPVFTTSITIDTGGPSWTHGTLAPAATQPIGSLYSRVGGAVGATLYVSRGAGVWAAVAGV